MSFQKLQTLHCFHSALSSVPSAITLGWLICSSLQLQLICHISCTTSPLYVLLSLYQSNTVHQLCTGWHSVPPASGSADSLHTRVSQLMLFTMMGVIPAGQRAACV